MILVMDYEINIAYSADVSTQFTLSEAEWARHDSGKVTKYWRVDR
jgi:hypothetical protein